MNCTVTVIVEAHIEIDCGVTSEEGGVIVQVGPGASEAHFDELLRPLYLQALYISVIIIIIIINIIIIIIIIIIKFSTV